VSTQNIVYNPVGYNITAFEFIQNWSYKTLVFDSNIDKLLMKFCVNICKPSSSLQNCLQNPHTSTPQHSFSLRRRKIVVCVINIHVPTIYNNNNNNNKKNYHFVYVRELLSLPRQRCCVTSNEYSSNYLYNFFKTKHLTSIVEVLYIKK